MGVVAHSANPAIPRLPTALPASLSQEPKYSGIPTIIATMKTRLNSSMVKAPDQLTVSQPLSLVTDHDAMKGLGESSSGEVHFCRSVTSIIPACSGEKAHAMAHCRVCVCA